MNTYKQDNMTIHNADCMEIMAQYEDNYFDLCVTSPPYNMNLRVNQKRDGYCSRQIVKELSSKYTNFNDNLPMGEYEGFLKNIIGELIRVSKLTFFNIQMITGNKPALFSVLGHFSKYIKEVIIWDKVNGQPAIQEGVMNSQFEFIFVFSNDSITRSFGEAGFSRGTLSNVWNIKRESSRDSSHGAVFPQSLCNRVFDKFGSRGMSVIDPFLGTGTSAIAAHYAKMGEFVGCELDEDYFTAACERIRKETRQLELF